LWSALQLVLKTGGTEKKGSQNWTFYAFQ